MTAKRLVQDFLQDIRDYAEKAMSFTADMANRRYCNAMNVPCWR